MSAGAWSYECSWEIQTAAGVVLLEGGAPDNEVLCMSAPDPTLAPSPKPTSNFVCTDDMYSECCVADDDEDPCKDSTTW